MNAKQIQAAQLATIRADRANRFSTGEALNGVLQWERLDWPGTNDLILSGSNCATARWFETNIHILLQIGPRGGVKVLSAMGMSIKLIK